MTPSADLKQTLETLDFEDLLTYFQYGAIAQMWTHFFTPDRLRALHQLQTTFTVQRILDGTTHLVKREDLQLQILNSRYSLQEPPALRLSLPTREACALALHLWGQELPADTPFEHQGWHDPIRWATLPFTFAAPDLDVSPFLDLQPQLHLGYPSVRRIPCADIEVTQRLDPHGRRLITAHWTQAPLTVARDRKQRILECHVNTDWFTQYATRNNYGGTLQHKALCIAWDFLHLHLEFPTPDRSNYLSLPDHIVWT